MELIIILGFNYMELIKLNFLNKSSGIRIRLKDFNFIKAILFGIGFSVSYTPCVGTFLTSALLQIADGKNLMEGVFLMTLFSLGLGVPFIVSAFFIEKLKDVFDIIKNHYSIVKKISGVVLVVMGVYIMFF